MSTSCAYWKLWYFASTQLLVLCKVKWRGLNRNIEDLEPGWHSIDKFLDTLLHERCFLTCYIALIWKWIRHERTDFTDCLQLILMSRIPRFFWEWLCMCKQLIPGHFSPPTWPGNEDTCTAKTNHPRHTILYLFCVVIPLTGDKPILMELIRFRGRERRINISLADRHQLHGLRDDENCARIQSVILTLVPSLMSWQLWNYYLLPEPDQEQCRSVLRNGSLVPGQH